MLWGVTPDGLATFDKLVGVDHIMRPFGMEKVATAAILTPLSAGMVSSDFHMETNKRTPEPVSVNFLAEDAWTYVVDLDDIAPFCQFPTSAYWDAGWATIGTDRWPDNMICGIDDNWRFSFTIPISKPKYTDWTIKLPHKESIDGFSLERETLFNRITKVHLSFPGTEANPVDLDVTQDTRQNFDFPPVTTDQVQIVRCGNRREEQVGDGDSQSPAEDSSLGGFRRARQAAGVDRRVGGVPARNRRDRAE